MSAGEPAELVGEVSRIVYANPENHWTVVRVINDDGGQTTVVGTLAGVREGERVRVWGRWTRDRRYGTQVQAHRFQVLLPATAVAIERYLSSGIIAGVGPKTARLMVKRFGAQTLEVIDRNPERLRSVKGIGEKKLAQLLKSWRANSEIRDVMVFLQGLGISPRVAVKIHKEYGVEAIGRVRANPYDLAQDVWGIGFHKADKIASELGIGEDNPARLRAGIIHVLLEARGQGHVCLPREGLLAGGESLMGVPADLLGAELPPLELNGRIVIDKHEDLVYIPELHRAERRIAEGFMRLLDAETAPAAESLLQLALRRAEADLDVELSATQRRAVSLALSSRVTVVTGGPGTGKTTIVRAIVSALEQLNERVSLCAPTGRAAKRMSIATRREARTIHRLLEWQPAENSFARDEYNPVAADAVIVDEVSMVDVPLCERLLTALETGTRLVLVGDVDQLPSVGPGSVLRDAIQCKVIPTIILDEIYRQAQGSLIVTNAHRILHGQLPTPPNKGDERADFYWLEREDPEGIKALIEKLITERIPAAFGLDPVRDVQVLTPMHRGLLGSEGLNDMLSHLLNPNRAQTRLAPGDKVMQIKNNYDKGVYNGDVGFVDRLAEDRRTLLVRFEEPEERIIVYEPLEQDQLVPAWCITIHKSQGSEYPAVVIPIHTQHFMMLRRNLVYTAVTRGRKLVLLVGSRRALGLALREGSVVPRYGQLAERIKVLAR
jgi:exodeoxyribonuclease V alpha subunit